MTRRPGWNAGSWRRLTGGLTLQELWFPFRQETRTSCRLYLRELARKLKDQPPSRYQRTRQRVAP